MSRRDIIILAIHLHLASVITAKYHSSFADISNSRISLSLIDDIDFSQSAYISEC